MIFSFSFSNLPTYFTLLSEDETNYKFIIRIIMDDSYICVIPHFHYSSYPDNRLMLFCLMLL